MIPRRPRALLALAALACLAASAAGDRLRPGRASEQQQPKPPGPRPRPAWAPEDPAAARPLETEPLAIVGAAIHPVTRPAIEAGTILLKDGVIQAIQPESARIPKGYRVIDAHGLQAWPGWVALGADGLGLTDDASAGGPDAMLQRGIGESFDPWSDQVELAASAGITTALVWRVPVQPRGPLAGRAAILKMSVREPAGALVSDLGGAVAGPALLGPEGRAAAREAVEAARRGEGADDERGKLWRALARREAPLIATFDAAGDIVAMTEVAHELGLRLLLVTPAEAWPLAGRLARDGVGVAQNVRHTWGKPREDRRSDVPGGWRPDAVARLTRAGVPTAIVTDSPTIALWGVAGRDLLDLPLEAAYGVRAGLTEQEAIESITIVPARLLGVDDRVGSLEVGKDADVLLLDGDPLDYRTFVRTTIVNGRVAHEAAKSRFWHGIVEERDEALRTRRDRP